MRQVPGWRYWCWLVSLLLLAATLLRPTWTVTQNIHRFVFVIDISQSMNTRDYHLPGFPSDRLSFVKAVLQNTIMELPCGSQAGLGIYAHKNLELLLEPLEVCRHGAAITNALAGIDWRSAWAGDSYIAYGLFNSLRQTKPLKAQLVFMSDGHQQPETAFQPHYPGHEQAAPGLIVGVGNPFPSPIPKLDLYNRMIGHWRQSDLPNPVESSRYQTSVKQSEGDEVLMSFLDESRLQELATLAGMTYLRLKDPEQLTEKLLAQPPTISGKVHRDLRPVLALTALVLILITYAV